MRALHRKLLRDLWRLRGQVLAIALVMASGVGVLVLEAIERIHEELGTSTVLITHNAVIADMADRVLIMGDGTIHEERRNAQRRPAREMTW